MNMNLSPEVERASLVGAYAEFPNGDLMYLPFAQPVNVEHFMRPKPRSKEHQAVLEFEQAHLLKVDEKKPEHSNNS